MSDKFFNPLGREYTPAEWAASRRVGLSEAKHSSKNPGGCLIYATGNYWPDHARKQAEDWKLVSDAMEREWSQDDA